MTTLRLLAAAAAATLLAAAPAAAADPPSAGCHGLAAKDRAGDQASQAPAAPDGPRENLDLLEGFFLGGTDGQPATVNTRWTNLDKSIPPGADAVSWYVSMGVNGTPAWIRALTDFTGLVAFDYGHFEDLGVTNFSVRDGETTGALFEGPRGVVQLELPADTIGKPGTKVAGVTFYGYEARQVLPAAAPTAVKGGFLYEVDSAPGKGQFIVGTPCPTVEAPAVAPPPEPAPVPAPSPNAGSSPLPVTLLTTKVRRAKAKRRLALRVRAAEEITQFGVQVTRGRHVVAKGARARLKGTRTFKLRLRRKLAKGTHRVAFVGTDTLGQRRFAAARLRVR